MATLTGAARVALGPDLPPFYTDDDALAGELAAASRAQSKTRCGACRSGVPTTRSSSSKIADINNVTTDGFAGSVTAALFLRRFVEKTPAWAHFDIFAWNPSRSPAWPGRRRGAGHPGSGAGHFATRFG